jgi:SAM-dependent methyltransferase
MPDDRLMAGNSRAASSTIPTPLPADLVAKETILSGYVGAQHEFHDAAFVRGWADRFVPTPPRIALFDLILRHISTTSLPNSHVVELGLGPGYMARHILERNSSVSYEGLDFSDAFLDVAKQIIGEYLPRVTLTKADLMNHGWPRSLSRQPGAIISTWALHDLGSQQAIADVYARCHAVLPSGGILLNGDFIKPDGIAWRYEPGRFEIGRHLELLRQAGFKRPESLASFEHNVDNPTAAQNYACLSAVR